MKKTTSIHIRGILFIVEEDAYETLQSYLLRLDAKLGKSEMKEEIIEDIELRITELFSDIQAGNPNKVIVQENVNFCIEKLGEPEDYIDTEEESPKSQAAPNYSSDRADKKLYRDVENANIAGVCAGLALYFNVDVLVIRIVFLVILFFAGFGFPLYIILWMVLPKANSHVDRLRMKGRPVTVENVREEVEFAAKRMTESSEKFARKVQRESSVQRGVNSIGRIFRLGLGLFVLFFAVSGWIAFLSFFVFQINVIPVSNPDGLYNLHELSLLFWSNGSELSFLWLLMNVCIALVLSFVLICGIKLTFNLDFKWFKYVSRTSLVAFVVATITLFYAGSRLSTEFFFQSEVETSLTVDAPILFIETEKNTEFDKLGQGFRIRESNHFWMIEKNDRLYLENNSYEFKTSDDSLYHISITAVSNGANQNIANKNAQHINYTIEQKGDSVIFSDEFSFPKMDKFRGQHLDVMIKIPKGKHIMFNNTKVDFQEEVLEEQLEKRSKHIYINGSGSVEIWD